MIHTQKDDMHSKGVSPVAAAVTGAVVGAGVAVAGAVALKDKKNREKVKEVLTTVKEQAMNYIEDIQTTANQKKEEMVTKGEKAAKKLMDTKQSMGKIERKQK